MTVCLSLLTSPGSICTVSSSMLDRSLGSKSMRSEDSPSIWAWWVSRSDDFDDIWSPELLFSPEILESMEELSGLIECSESPSSWEMVIGDLSMTSECTMGSTFMSFIWIWGWSVITSGSILGRTIGSTFCLPGSESIWMVPSCSWVAVTGSSS